MDSIILLFLCLFLGYGLQFVSTFPKNAHLTLNQFVIYVSLPALALYYIPKVQINSDLLYPLGVAWLGFLFSFLFFYFIGSKLGWSKKLIGCLIITAGLGNTSFIGFPVVQALFGEEGLKTAIIVDQPGSFVVMSTLGIFTASLFSKGQTDTKEIARKILLFPPFIGFFVACLLCVFQLDFLPEFQSVFQKLGSTVTPIALLSVGFQIRFDRNSQHWKFLRLGLFFKLILMPALFFFLYRIVGNGRGLTVDVSLIESAMAPMITGTILSASYGLKPKLSNMMVSVGIPLSFVTLAFWYYIIKTF
jgi:predicted permease